MAYYNVNGELFIPPQNFHYLSEGDFGDVETNGEIILKKYKMNSLHFFSYQLFRSLYSIDHEQLMKIYDVYSNQDKKINLLQSLGYKTGFLYFPIAAYIAKYYQDDNVDILSESKYYLLDNLHSLEELMFILSLKNIRVNDLKRENTILNKDKIVLIDPDFFYFSKESKKYILAHNKRDLLRLFYYLCYAQLNHSYISPEQEAILLDLCNIDIKYNTDLSYTLSRQLIGYRTVSDYLQR